jgi:mannose-6-phosphate isomerase-like protein (cupin superfamily)
MTELRSRTISLENRHTGERLNLTRVRQGDEEWFELKGSLPGRTEGPPLHVHFAEDEEGRVTAGTLTVEIDGRRQSAGPGDSTSVPRGSVHRWWNEGSEPLEFEGRARPAADLDRYLQAIFEIMNAGPPGRPSLFYLAHAALRHRRTQAVRLMPPALQAVLFRVVVAVGTLLGRYHGEDWPGCPSRCTGARWEGTWPAGGATGAAEDRR